MSMSLKKNNVSQEVMKASLGLSVSGESREALKKIVEQMDRVSQGFSNFNKELGQKESAPSNDVTAPRFQQ